MIPPEVATAVLPWGTLYCVHPHPLSASRLGFDTAREWLGGELGDKVWMLYGEGVGGGGTVWLSQAAHPLPGLGPEACSRHLSPGGQGQRERAGSQYHLCLPWLTPLGHNRVLWGQKWAGGALLLNGGLSWDSKGGGSRQPTNWEAWALQYRQFTQTFILLGGGAGLRPAPSHPLLFNPQAAPKGLRLSGVFGP